jgi:hypothetical protein
VNQNLKYLLSLLIISISFTTTTAQSVSNITPKIDGDQIVITYDLEGIENSESDVTFYFGDNKLQKNMLKYAAGDVGSDIRTGKNKRVEITNFKAFLPYMKNLTFRGEASYSFIPISDFSSTGGDKVRRKQTVPLSWEGGLENDPISLTLIQNGKPIEKFINIKKRNEYEFHIPKRAPKGTGYQIVLTDSKGNKQSTSEFKVKRKFPVVLTTIGVAAVGVAAYLVYHMIDDVDTNPRGEPEQELPGLPPGAHPGG